MAKILMVQIQCAPYCGTAYLNGAAKSAGHKFSLILSNTVPDILARIAKEKPDLIGFCCMSSFFREIIPIARKIKKQFAIPIIFGGPHPTLFPDILHEESIDMICRGEGEFALIELLRAIDQKKSYTRIKNLWVKSKRDRNIIYKNEMRPLIYPLDNAPLIDWSCYQHTAVLYGSPTVFLIRGCPFSCNYCFNQETRMLYSKKGPYVRHFSVDRSIREIKQALKYFPKNPVLFTSDSFGIDLPWMDAVLKRYTKLTKLPFVLLLRPELTSQACVDLIAKYNCCSVSIGVESGSERVRFQILQRNYTNTYLIEMARRLHAKGIKFKTFNMIGLPTESEKEMWETVDVNIAMQADYPRAAIFTPFPGTKIIEIAKDKGYLSKDYDFKDLPETILDRSILKKLNHDRVQNTLFFFQTAIKFPFWKNVLRKLTKTKPNVLYRLWFYGVYALMNGLAEKRQLTNYIPYLYANRQYK